MLYEHFRHDLFIIFQAVLHGGRHGICARAGDPSDLVASVSPASLLK